jgi:hypothetical protein
MSVSSMDRVRLATLNDPLMNWDRENGGLAGHKLTPAGTEAGTCRYSDCLMGGYHRTNKRHPAMYTVVVTVQWTKKDLT